MIFLIIIRSLIIKKFVIVTEPRQKLIHQLFLLNFIWLSKNNCNKTARSLPFFLFWQQNFTMIQWTSKHLATKSALKNKTRDQEETKNWKKKFLSLFTYFGNIFRAFFLLLLEPKLSDGKGKNNKVQHTCPRVCLLCRWFEKGRERALEETWPSVFYWL